MSKLLYMIFVGFYQFAVYLIAPFNTKARLWKEGRKNIFNNLQQTINHNEKIIWMHCASLGEFEQGRPVLENLKLKFPSYKLLLTFFSPSGYEVRKNYSGVDYVFYLPIDNRRNAKLFFDIVKPAIAIFIKYDFWHYYLTEAKNRKTPLLLVSGIFRKDQPFFASYGDFHRNMLRCFTYLFVQNDESLALLTSIGIAKNVSVAGDTRFDRVIEIAEQFKPIPAIEEFCKGQEVIVAGSTWAEDDEELAHYAKANSHLKFIIAPHHISKDRIAQCSKLYGKAVLFSSLQTGSINSNANTLIIDNIGMLSRLYKYSTVSYIGGGFGREGIHNILEAAVYGKPVVFGPEYSKYMEAVELIEEGGAFSIESALELEKILTELLEKGTGYTKASRASLNYVFSKRGSTDKIISYIQENRLLTS